MAQVGLKGMLFYAFHGYYDFERRIGNQFSVDVTIDFEMDEDPKEKITNTFNYEIILDTCKIFMKRRYRLLESLAYDIAKELKESDSIVRSVNVRIEKLNPKLSGKVSKAFVEIVV